jgi:hypothetical protein
MDFILIVLTLALGVVGTLWKGPPVPAKVILVVLLLASSVASAWKAVTDERDKELLETLAVAGLALPNGAYDKVYQRLDEVMGKGTRGVCHHTSQGMTCFGGIDKNTFEIHSKSHYKYVKSLLYPHDNINQIKDSLSKDTGGVFVFNRYEVAKIYSDAVRGRDTK